ncbi:hypothetical protein NVP1284A_05 [Vibrio phage 1.284.A._10N.286.55.A5]|nr:hypothetical protein NVP1284A_05 [Vibrio phage 1.284.A._10N.286.55.A5]
MKNTQAKKLMINCIKSRDNGECYIVNKVSIKTANLGKGSVMAHSTYIGDLDSVEALNNVCDFVTKIAMSTKGVKS